MKNQEEQERATKSNEKQQKATKRNEKQKRTSELEKPKQAIKGTKVQMKTRLEHYDSKTISLKEIRVTELKRWHNYL